jgi:CO dehydrogenase/acetyl-CoA synthase gamma subunit (corrinoid Fe-S protein)
MRVIDKYLTEAKVKLKQSEIKKFISAKKPGTYVIDGKDVKVTLAADTVIVKYPSDFYELTYILIDISDDMGYAYQQVGMNTKKEMKFIIDMEK